jgi:hypothetical protein
MFVREKPVSIWKATVACAALLIAASVPTYAKMDLPGASALENCASALMAQPSKNICLMPSAAKSRSALGVQVAEECYAICTYKDSSGTRFMGMSSGGCSDACSEAESKCNSEGSGGCSKQGCTATGCD